MTKQRALTNWRQQREGQVRTQKETTEEGHSQTGDGRGRDKSGHRKKVTEQGVLANWRQQREGQVRIQKGSE